MKCITCNIEIPPIWTGCIKSNICPQCNGPIMDESSITLLTELKEAIEKMAENPAGLVAGLAGWLLSNYTLTKIGTAEPTQFHTKPNRQRSNSKKMVIANGKSDQFMKRAGIPAKALSDNKKNYRAIIEEINSGEDTMYGSNEPLEDVEEELDEDQESEMLEGEVMDEEDEAEFDDNYEEAEFNRQQMHNKMKAKRKNMQNILVPSNGKNQRPVSVHEVESVMKNASKSGSTDFSQIPALNVARMKRLEAQEDIANGGTVGSIRRS